MKQSNPKQFKKADTPKRPSPEEILADKEQNALVRYWRWYREKKRLKKESKKKPETFGEIVWSWTKTLVGAIIVVMIINGLLIASFVVPTGSMENTVMTGDFLFVNKFVYGPSTPQVIPFLNIPLPYLRFPGVKEPEKGDVIVFIYPGGLNELKPKEFQYYLKRCVGVGGDTLQVVNGVLYVNSQIFPDPEFINYEPAALGTENNPTFPRHIHGWTANNYGPLVIPKTGDTIKLTVENLAGWDIFIQREGHKIEENLGKILIDGKEANFYVVERDYVFGMGDHRNHSEDSRSWGFIPVENVVGTPLMVYWSWNPDISFFDFFNKMASVRWSRIGTLID